MFVVASATANSLHTVTWNCFVERITNYLCCMQVPSCPISIRREWMLSDFLALKACVVSTCEALGSIRSMQGLVHRLCHLPKVGIPRWTQLRTLLKPSWAVSIRRLRIPKVRWASAEQVGYISSQKGSLNDPCIVPRPQTERLGIKQPEMRLGAYAPYDS